MTEAKIAPYGSWKSPITSDLIVTGSIGLHQSTLDGEDVYWTEMRPSEGGRSVIVRRSADGRTEDVTPPPFNSRTRVHEYGGGDYLVADGTLYFSNFSDQRIYRQRMGQTPEAITPAVEMRYADAVSDARRNRLVCVREDHTEAGREAVNTLVSIDLEGEDSGRVIASGNDFYSSPRLSADGSRLAFLTWNHPNMPWDGTELWVSELDEAGSVTRSVRVAGGLRESIFQPEWSADGTLHFISDRSGWWNLYRFSEGRVEPLCPMEAEFGQPQWVFGMSVYGFESPTRIICAYTERGHARLARLDTVTRKLEAIETPYADITYLRVNSGGAVFRGGSPSSPACIARLDLATGETAVLRRSNDLKIDGGYLSIAQAVEFPTENGLTAHAFFYPPQNRDFSAPPGERPPLLVKSHGGPTSAASPTLSLNIQYWTSRGIGVLDVNYGGSTGYGRAYRERLKGQWGVVDVDDCVNGARHMAARGLVDGERLMIDGGSAGGYTTLCALTFRDAFKAGASHFGVSDAGALARETHKFESRYLDGLIGPYPEREDLYKERSPIYFADRLSCPVIFFQGLEDKVVPPNQAELMVVALRAKGVPVAYVAFEGEQHGFRRAENIKRALDGELYFYSRVFGFELADRVEPVEIENLNR
ncbi:MAG TPA: S9 family peptidase [Pyrinomonadaceae bacterium]|jgi:dipeptidyl aminopeptidase/acylaminoacyl peptidase|nr:S9 family peptidase [Pyrinomonadaceae bacterium]